MFKGDLPAESDSGAVIIPQLYDNDVINKLIDDTAALVSGMIRGNVVKWSATYARWELCDGTVALGQSDVIGIVEYVNENDTIGQVRVAGVYTDSNLGANTAYYCQANGTLGTTATKVSLGRTTSAGRLVMPVGGGGISPATATTLGGIKSIEVTADGTLPSHRKQLFTASGSFVVPDGVTQVWVTICGAGGNGGNGFTTSGGYTIAGGGGGGAAAKRAFLVTGLTPGSTVAITVGLTSGQASSFGAYVSCPGGGNGVAGSNSGNGAVGAAGGEGGTPGYQNVCGGHSLFGVGGMGPIGWVSDVNGMTYFYGDPPCGFGSGGSGGVGNGRAGKAGAPGFVLVEW